MTAQAPHPIPYTRAQLAAAVDEAHDALHEYLDPTGLPLAFQPPQLRRAHDALHRVGAGVERTGCGLPDAARDPELQQLVADWMARLDRELPCGHTFAELVSGAGTVTFCGACADVRRAQREAKPKTRVTNLRVSRSDTTAAINEVVVRHVERLFLEQIDAHAVDVRIEVALVPRDEEG